MTLAIGWSKEAPVTVKRNGATYVTVTELARVLGVHRNTVIYWIGEEQVKAVRSGFAKKSRWLIPVEEARRVVKELTPQK